MIYGKGDRCKTDVKPMQNDSKNEIIGNGMSY